MGSWGACVEHGVASELPEDLAGEREEGQGLPSPSCKEGKEVGREVEIL